MKFKKILPLLMLCAILASTLLLSACDLSSLMPQLPIGSGNEQVPATEETTPQETEPQEGLYKLEIQTVFP